MKDRILFHSYKTVATVVDTDTLFLRHLDREDLLRERELLAFYRFYFYKDVALSFTVFSKWAL